MSEQRLNTEQIANKITDQLDTYRTMGIIPSTLFDKLSSFRVLMAAINEADIQISGFIKQETQVVVFAPEGATEVFVRNSDIDSAEHINALIAADIRDVDEAILLDAAPWRQVGQIRSQYIYAHSEYPIADAVHGTAIRFVPFAFFQNRRKEYRESPVAYYDAARCRIRLSKALTSDSFLTFEAYLLPEILDINLLGDNDYESYEICAPYYAGKAVELQALAELLPSGIELTESLARKAEEEKRRVVARMPRDHSTLTVEPRF